MSPTTYYPQMKKSNVAWIGSIPSHWKIGRVKNAFFATKTIVGEQSNNYERLALTLNGVVKRSKTDGGGLQPEQFETYQILRENELVFKLIDLQNVSTSRVGRSPYDGIVSPAYIVLHEKNNNPTYYAEYFFLAMWMHRIFNNLGADGVRSNIGVSSLLNLPYPLVPPEEQSAIASYLTSECATIDSIISETKGSIQEYTNWKDSVIYKAVTKGVNSSAEMKNSGIDVIGQIPAHWEIKRLKNLGTLQNGISKSAEYFGQGFPFVSYGDVYRNCSLPINPLGRISSTEEEQSNYSVKRGDVFFTRTSETIEEVGFSSVCEQTIPHATFAGFLIRFRPSSTELVTGFSKYFFRSPHHRSFFAKEMNLVTRASLSQDLLKSMPVIIPPKDEQEQIAKYLDEMCSSIDTLIADKRRLITELESYKKSLIYEVVTGKRKVV